MNGAGERAASAGVAVRMFASRGQGHEVVGAHHPFDILQPLAVVRHQLVGRDRRLFQLADHVAVVGRRQVVARRDDARHDLHLVAHFLEVEAGALDHLFRRDVDADVGEAIHVDDFRQTHFLACARHEARFHPIVVVLHLGLQRREVAFPAGDVRLLEQLRDAVHVGRVVVQAFLDLAHVRADQRLVGQAFLAAGARQHGDRGVVRFLAGVAFQAHERELLAFRLVARVEQGAQAAVHDFAHVDVFEQVLVLQLHRGDLLFARVDQDVEVLAHLGVLLLCALATQFGEALFRVGQFALPDARFQVGDLRVVVFVAQFRGFLRHVFTRVLQDRLGVGVAARDPCGCCCAGGAGCEQEGEAETDHDAALSW